MDEMCSWFSYYPVTWEEQIDNDAKREIWKTGDSYFTRQLRSLETSCNSCCSSKIGFKNDVKLDPFRKIRLN